MGAHVCEVARLAAPAYILAGSTISIAGTLSANLTGPDTRRSIAAELLMKSAGERRSSTKARSKAISICLRGAFPNSPIPQGRSNIRLTSLWTTGKKTQAKQKRPKYPSSLSAPSKFSRITLAMKVAPRKIETTTKHSTNTLTFIFDTVAERC